VLEAFEQYNDLLFKLDLVLKAICDSKENSDKYDMTALENEHRLVFDKKDLFEKRFSDELEYFDKTYGVIMQISLNAIFEIIRSRDNSVSLLIYYIM